MKVQVPMKVLVPNEGTSSHVGLVRGYAWGGGREVGGRYAGLYPSYKLLSIHSVFHCIPYL